MRRRTQVRRRLLFVAKRCRCQPTRYGFLYNSLSRSLFSLSLSLSLSLSVCVCVCVCACTPTYDVCLYAHTHTHLCVYTCELLISHTEILISHATHAETPISFLCQKLLERNAFTYTLSLYAYIRIYRRIYACIRRIPTLLCQHA